MKTFINIFYNLNVKQIKKYISLIVLYNKFGWFPKVKWVLYKNVAPIAFHLIVIISLKNCWKTILDYFSAMIWNKVHIFWEGHQILRNLHQLFILCTASQIMGGDFAKFCGLLRIYELYKIHTLIDFWNFTWWLSESWLCSLKTDR